MVHLDSARELPVSTVGVHKVIISLRSIFCLNVVFMLYLLYKMSGYPSVSFSYRIYPAIRRFVPLE